LSHAVMRGSRGVVRFRAMYGPGREAGVLPCRQRRPSACSYLRCSGGERQWTNPRGDSEDNRLSRAPSPPWQKVHERVLRDVLAHIGAYRLSVPGRPALEMHACHAVVSSTQSAIFSSSCTAGLTAAPGPIARPTAGVQAGQDHDLPPECQRLPKPLCQRILSARRVPTSVDTRGIHAKHGSGAPLAAGIR
jgi:hypothetical protein